MNLKLPPLKKFLPCLTPCLTWLILVSCSKFEPRAEYDTDALNFIALALINSYQQDISPADGPRSGSYPTGSAYGEEAFLRYGFFAGLIITSDRLVHETEKSRAGLIELHGVRRKYDPLDFNVYWWDDKIKQKYSQ